jgi:hypothetical protein
LLDTAMLRSLRDSLLVMMPEPPLDKMLFTSWI